jgi:SAM-dependent methyltransferase
MLRRLLAHPLTRGLDIDDPATTILRRTIVQSKPFLKRIYEEWYQVIANCLPDIPGRVLELGSGAGFLADYIPGLITSEIFHCPHVRVVLDGQLLPIANESLRGIVMINVLHHVPDTRAFLMEAARCLRPGGVIAMIEPWVSPWSHLIYTRLHHEPFETHVRDWRHPSNGPLSGANGALPLDNFQA